MLSSRVSARERRSWRRDVSGEAGGVAESARFPRHVAGSSTLAPGTGCLPGNPFCAGTESPKSAPQWEGDLKRAGGPVFQAQGPPAWPLWPGANSVGGVEVPGGAACRLQTPGTPRNRQHEINAGSLSAKGVGWPRSGRRRWGRGDAGQGKGFDESAPGIVSSSLHVVAGFRWPQRRTMPLHWPADQDAQQQLSCNLASSQIACHRSRSRGVGARISRRCKSLASIRHCLRNRSISHTPITNPSLTPRLTSPVPPQIYPTLLRISPWFRKGPAQIRRPRNCAGAVRNWQPRVDLQGD